MVSIDHNVKLHYNRIPNTFPGWAGSPGSFRLKFKYLEQSFFWRIRVSQVSMQIYNYSIYANQNMKLQDVIVQKGQYFYLSIYY